MFALSDLFRCRGERSRLDSSFVHDRLIPAPIELGAEFIHGEAEDAFRIWAWPDCSSMVLRFVWR